MNAIERMNHEDLDGRNITFNEARSLGAVMVVAAAMVGSVVAEVMVAADTVVVNGMLVAVVLMV